MCAFAYIFGIRQFGKGRILREVHFVDTDSTMVDEMKIALSVSKKYPISITPETLKSLYPKHFEIRDEDHTNAQVGELIKTAAVKY